LVEGSLFKTAWLTDHNITDWLQREIKANIKMLRRALQNKFGLVQHPAIIQTYSDFYQKIESKQTQQILTQEEMSQKIKTATAQLTQLNPQQPYPTNTGIILNIAAHALNKKTNPEQIKTFETHLTNWMQTKGENIQTIKVNWDIDTPMQVTAPAHLQINPYQLFAKLITIEQAYEQAMTIALNNNLHQETAHIEALTLGAVINENKPQLTQTQQTKLTQLNKLQNTPLADLKVEWRTTGPTEIDLAQGIIYLNLEKLNQQPRTIIEALIHETAHRKDIVDVKHNTAWADETITQENNPQKQRNEIKQQLKELKQNHPQIFEKIAAIFSLKPKTTDKQDEKGNLIKAAKDRIIEQGIAEIIARAAEQPELINQLRAHAPEIANQLATYIENIWNPETWKNVDIQPQAPPQTTIDKLKNKNKQMHNEEPSNTTPQTPTPTISNHWVQALNELKDEQIPRMIKRFQANMHLDLDKILNAAIRANNLRIAKHLFLWKHHSQTQDTKTLDIIKEIFKDDQKKEQALSNAMLVIHVVQLATDEVKQLILKEIDTGDKLQALYHFAKNDMTEAVEYLINQDINTNQLLKNGWKLIEIAVNENAPTALKNILESGASIDAKLLDQLLCKATQEQQDENIKTLLMHGADTTKDKILEPTITLVDAQTGETVKIYKLKENLVSAIKTEKSENKRWILLSLASEEVLRSELKSVTTYEQAKKFKQQLNTIIEQIIYDLRTPEISARALKNLLDAIEKTPDELEKTIKDELEKKGRLNVKNKIEVQKIYNEIKSELAKNEIPKIFNAGIKRLNDSEESSINAKYFYNRQIKLLQILLHTGTRANWSWKLLDSLLTYNQKQQPIEKLTQLLEIYSTTKKQIKTNPYLQERVFRAAHEIKKEFMAGPQTKEMQCKVQMTLLANALELLSFACDFSADEQALRFDELFIEIIQIPASDDTPTLAITTYLLEKRPDLKPQLQHAVKQRLNAMIKKERFSWKSLPLIISQLWDKEYSKDEELINMLNQIQLWRGQYYQDEDFYGQELTYKHDTIEQLLININEHERTQITKNIPAFAYNKLSIDQRILIKKIIKRPDKTNQIQTLLQETKNADEQNIEQILDELYKHLKNGHELDENDITHILLLSYAANREELTKELLTNNTKNFQQLKNTYFHRETIATRNLPKHLKVDFPGYSISDRYGDDDIVRSLGHIWAALWTERKWQALDENEKTLPKLLEILTSLNYFFNDKAKQSLQHAIENHQKYKELDLQFTNYCLDDGISIHDVVKTLINIDDDRLEFAIENIRNIDSSKWAILFGADVTKKGPLFECVKYQKTEKLQLLLEHGANPNITYSDGPSLLDRAKELNNNKICQLLITHGANPIKKHTPQKLTIEEINKITLTKEFFNDWDVQTPGENKTYNWHSLNQLTKNLYELLRLSADEFPAEWAKLVRAMEDQLKQEIFKKLEYVYVKTKPELTHENIFHVAIV